MVYCMKKIMYYYFFNKKATQSVRFPEIWLNSEKGRNVWVPISFKIHLSSLRQEDNMSVPQSFYENQDNIPKRCVVLHTEWHQKAPQTDH